MGTVSRKCPLCMGYIFLDVNFRNMWTYTLSFGQVYGIHHALFVSNWWVHNAFGWHVSCPKVWTWLWWTSLWISRTNGLTVQAHRTVDWPLCHTVRGVTQSCYAWKIILIQYWSIMHSVQEVHNMNTKCGSHVCLAACQHIFSLTSNNTVMRCRGRQGWVIWIKMCVANLIVVIII